MFDKLNSRERANLARKLASARQQFLSEYDLLTTSPARVRAAYGVGAGTVLVTDWLFAGIECGQLGTDLAKIYTPAGAR